MDKAQRSILFVDVCNSTKLMESLGDERGRAVLVACFDVLRMKADEFAGTVLDEIGDELMISFADPGSAAKAACGMHAAMADAATAGRIPPGVHVRIGFHHGPVVISADGIFGKTIHLAKRVASVSKAQQIVTSRQTLELLSPDAGVPSRFLDRIHVKGHDDVLEMHEILWDETMGTIVEYVTHLPSSPRAVIVLRVSHGERSDEIGPTRPVLTVGRDEHCDVVIDHPRVSRLHGRFEFRKNGYVFVDASANGSHVVVIGAEPMYLRRDEAALPGDGAIVLGGNEPGAPTVRFALRSEPGEPR